MTQPRQSEPERWHWPAIREPGGIIYNGLLSAVCFLLGAALERLIG